MCVIFLKEIGVCWVICWKCLSRLMDVVLVLLIICVIWVKVVFCEMVVFVKVVGIFSRVLNSDWKEFFSLLMVLCRVKVELEKEIVDW